MSCILLLPYVDVQSLEVALVIPDVVDIEVRIEPVSCLFAK
jgi:hypothetical protein